MPRNIAGFRKWLSDGRLGAGICLRSELPDVGWMWEVCGATPPRLRFLGSPGGRFLGKPELFAKAHLRRPCCHVPAQYHPLKPNTLRAGLKCYAPCLVCIPYCSPGLYIVPVFSISSLETPLDNVSSRRLTSSMDPCAELDFARFRWRSADDTSQRLRSRIGCSRNSATKACRNISRNVFMSSKSLVIPLIPNWCVCVCANWCLSAPSGG